ncbi:MAG: GNAT family N-acetyltransferase [Candidatus Saccharibacteria bacterium]
MDLMIKNFAADERAVRPTKPKGFLVEAIGLSASFKCYEGFNLAPRHAESVIEPDVLELDFLHVGEGASGHGFGRLLMERALSEAKLKGFATARAVVRNPGIINIVDNLRGRGIILRADYILSPAAMGLTDNRLATPLLLEQPLQMTSQQASDYLNGLVLDRDGMYLGTVDEQVEKVITF